MSLWLWAHKILIQITIYGQIGYPENSRDWRRLETMKEGREVQGKKPKIWSQGNLWVQRLGLLFHQGVALWNSPDGPVLGTMHFHCQGPGPIPSQDLRSCKLWGMAKKKKSVALNTYLSLSLIFLSNKMKTVTVPAHFKWSHTQMRHLYAIISHSEMLAQELSDCVSYISQSAENPRNNSRKVAREVWVAEKSTLNCCRRWRWHYMTRIWTKTKGSMARGALTATANITHKRGWHSWSRRGKWFS